MEKTTQLLLEPYIRDLEYRRITLTAGLCLYTLGLPNPKPSTWCRAGACAIRLECWGIIHEKICEDMD